MESKIRHKWTYLQSRNTFTDIENRLVAKEEAGGGEMDGEFGISRCKLVYIEWIDNKVLLHSTGNDVQYAVTNHNGRECEQEYRLYVYIHYTLYYTYYNIRIYYIIHIYYICVYISESLSFTAEINTALWINYILILKKKEKLQGWEKKAVSMQIWSLNIAM